MDATAHGQINQYIEFRLALASLPRAHFENTENYQYERRH